MEDIFRELLNRNGIDPILILVDTTFNLSDECYATIVTFRDTEFVNKPVIPLQIYLHEKKDGDAHDHGMDTLAKVFPEINQSDKVDFITDGEKAIRNAVEKHFPGKKIFRCVIHAWVDIKIKIRQILGHKDNALELKVRKDFEQLLRSKDVLQYKTLLSEKYIDWEKEISVSAKHNFKNILNNSSLGLRYSN